MNSDFSARSALFVIFARGTPLICGFQQSAWVREKNIFSMKSARFVIFHCQGAPLLSDFRHSARVCTKQRFSTFSHFLLGAPRFSDFQQSARVCGKQLFEPEISTSRHFCPGHTTFQRFSAKCTSLSKTAFLARHQHVLFFSQWAHYFLAISSELHEFVQNILFSPRSARFQPEISNFCHFRTGVTTFKRFLTKCESLYKTGFSARD